MATMVCPQCGKAQEHGAECVYCGIVIAKYERLHAAPAEAPAPRPDVTPPPSDTLPRRSDFGFSGMTWTPLLRYALFTLGVVVLAWWAIPSPSRAPRGQQAGAPQHVGSSLMDREREAYEEPADVKAARLRSEVARKEEERVKTEEAKAAAARLAAMPPEPKIPLPPNGPLDTCKEGPGGIVVSLEQPNRDLARLYSDRIPDQVHTLVKLVGPTVCEIFIHSGAETGVKLPAGRYDVRWAVGSRWMGRDELFGPDTSFFQADDPVKLADAFAVKLTLNVTFGNLGKSEISRSAF